MPQDLYKKQILVRYDKSTYSDIDNQTYLSTQHELNCCFQLTCLRSRAERIRGGCSCTTVSIVGYAFSLSSHLFPLNLSSMFTIISWRRVKQWGSKWAEHRAEYEEGFQFGRCFWTNFLHKFVILPSALGKPCIDIPSVRELFLQLTLPGPPATQYFPNCFCFFFERLQPSSTLFEDAIFTVTVSDWL